MVVVSQQSTLRHVTTLRRQQCDVYTNSKRHNGDCLGFTLMGVRVYPGDLKTQVFTGSASGIHLIRDVSGETLTPSSSNTSWDFIRMPSSPWGSDF